MKKALHGAAGGTTKGLFTQAQWRNFFLDEIGDMPLATIPSSCALQKA